MRYITANLHPDHDTIATFRVKNAVAIQEAFKTVLLLANETGLLKVGSIALDGTKLDANASKIKSIRYDRIQQLRKKLDKDIAELMEKAKTADQNPQDDGLSVPDNLARRQELKDKLDAAAKRLEEAEKQHAAPKESESESESDDDHTPSPKVQQQTNLTDPDSAIMRKSNRHEYRQAYNAQAAVCADGSMLVLATDVLSTSNDRAGLVTILEQLGEGFLKPKKLLADSGYAGEQFITFMNGKGIDPFIPPNRQQAERPYCIIP